MAKCAFCSSTVLFGGVKEEGQRFCNEDCYRNGVTMAVSHELPADEVRNAVAQVHGGPCPRCEGSGPIDVTTTYKIWSLVLMSSWRSDPEICCRSCGRKSQAWGLFSSLLLGWWGFPWGLIMTPVQVFRNAAGLFRDYDPYTPSEELESSVRLIIAADLIADAQAQAQAEASAAS